MEGIKDIRQSFLLSLVFHLVVMGALVFLAPRFQSIPEVPETVWIEVDPLPPKPKVDSQDDEYKKMIVQSKAGEVVEKAAKDAYLGEANRIVDRETIAKSSESLEAERESAPETKQLARPKAEPHAMGSPKTPTLSNLGLPVVQSRMLPQAQREEEAYNWSDPAGQYGKVNGEYIKGIKEGEQTSLNTKEYVYFSYFERIRKQLDLSWKPVLRKSLTKLFYAGRSLASEMDHITKLLVTLDSRGEVVRVQILEESGTRDLDQAAIQAFNNAGPFPNPPSGITEKDGTIQIRWDFILKT